MVEERQFSVWRLSSGPRPSERPTTTFRNRPDSQVSQRNGAQEGRIEFLVGRGPRAGHGNAEVLCLVNTGYDGEIATFSRSLGLRL